MSDEAAADAWYEFQTHLAVEEAVRAERERVLAALESRKGEFCSNGYGWIVFDDMVEEIRAGK